MVRHLTRVPQASCPSAEPKALRHSTAVWIVWARRRRAETRTGQCAGDARDERFAPAVRPDGGAV